MYDLILFGYVLIAGAACNLLGAPEIVKAFLSLPTLIILPYLLGKYAMTPCCFLRNRISRFNNISKTLIFWCFGVILITFFAVLLTLLNLFSVYTLIAMTVLVPAIGLASKKQDCWKKSITDKRSASGLLIVGLISVTLATIFRGFAPFPLQPGLDIFSHTLIINKIVEQNYFSLFLTNFSSAFLVNAYLPSYHLLISVLSKIFNTEPLSIFWTTPFLSIFIFSAGTFLFSLKVSKNFSLSLIAALIGAGIIESGRVVGITYFVPSTVVMLLMPFCLYTILDQKLEEVLLAGIFFIPVLLFFSFFTGFLFLVVLIAYLAITKLSQTYPEKFRGLLILFVFGVFLFLLTQKYALFSIDKIISFDWFRGNTSIEYMLSGVTKLNLLQSWYSLPVLCLTALGCLWALINYKINELKMLGVFSVLLLLYALPVAFIERLAQFIHVFVSYFAASAVIVCIGRATSTVARLLQVFLFLTLLMLLLFSLNIQYITTVRSWNNLDGSFTFFSQDEYLMGGWLKKNTPQTSVVLSDPLTQAVIAALANRESLRGAFPYPEEQKSLKEIILTSNAVAANNQIKSLVENNFTVIIISGRTYKWAAQNKFDLVHGPQKFQNFSGFEKFYDGAYFEYLYDVNNEVYAFRLVDLVSPTLSKNN